jgi:hypothetical protein
MSIFLDIEPVPFRLLDDLMARMEANNDRLRARRGEKGSTDRPRARRPAHNAEESTYRRPEPAASPQGALILATAFLHEGYIYSGDGAQRVEIPPLNIRLPQYDGHYIPPVESDEYSYYTFEDPFDRGTGKARVSFASSTFDFVLPAGGHKLIYVTGKSTAWVARYIVVEVYKGDPEDPPEERVRIETEIYRYEDNHLANLSWDCFIVDRSTARQIATPSGLAAILSDQLRTYRVVAGSANIVEVVMDVPVENLEVASLEREGSLAYYNLSGSQVTTYGAGGVDATPVIFDSLGADLTGFGFDYPRWDSFPAVEEAFPSTLRARRFVQPNGTFNEAFPSSQQFVADIWQRPFDDGEQSVINGALRPPQRQIRLRYPTPYPPSLAGSDANPLEATILVAWDWDQPSYCRQRLLALGFTNQDLA